VLEGAEIQQLIAGVPLAPARIPPKRGGEGKPQPAAVPEEERRLPGLREGEHPQPA